LSKPPVTSETSHHLSETLLVLRGFVVRPMSLLLVAVLIGVVDDLQVRYLDVANFGTDAEILYQAGFIVAAAAGTYLVLRRREWGTGRNLTNLLMALPVAAIADNVSIDAGTLKPYFFAIPGQGYEWRQAVFGHTAGLSNVAGMVNHQTLAPGVLDGYVAALVIAPLYLLLQWALQRREERHTAGPLRVLV
jgi:hypothetical protein